MTVERGKTHSDELLRGKVVNALSPADRNLVTALVLGVLRWQIQLDARIRTLLKRPNAKLDVEILIALRMGAFQLERMDRVPARAAIDESVELTKQAGHRYASGMVNAVLRKLAGGTRSMDGLENSAAELALAQAHPRWMVERWVDFYGLDAAHAICKHGQVQPATTVRLASTEVEEELLLAGVGVEPGELLTTARLVCTEDVTATAAFREGRVRIQDEGSQLVAEIAACAAQRFQGGAKRILDACAAPGGKTLILAERNPQARIVACEASAQRLAQLRKRLDDFGQRVECRLGDASALKEDASFDVVLADVPCSGTGTLGRNPEIRHRLKPEDLPRQAERQRAILSAVLRSVRAGGRVVYSTCSLEPEENEQVVAGVLAADAKARQVPLEALVGMMTDDRVLTVSSAQRLRGCLTPEGALRLLPGVFGTDGFFVAVLERTA